MRTQLAEISAKYNELNSVKLEKAQIRMEETVISRDVKAKATMKVSGEYVAEIPPHRFTETRGHRQALWLPGETLPRYARHMCETLRMDVIIGNQAYYSFNPTGKTRRQAGRQKYKWWIGTGHDELDMAAITMEITQCARD